MVMDNIVQLYIIVTLLTRHMISGTTLDCTPVYQTVGKSVTLTATLDKETSWNQVTWTKGAQTVETCSTNCNKEGLNLLHQTERLRVTGFSKYSVEMEKQWYTVKCSSTLAVFGKWDGVRALYI